MAGNAKMLPEPIHHLIHLKGAPASILLALGLKAGPLGVEDLAQLTGCGRHQVRAGLDVLQAAGLVNQIRRYAGWRLTPAGEQFLAQASQEARSCSPARPETASPTNPHSVSLQPEPDGSSSPDERPSRRRDTAARLPIESPINGYAQTARRTKPLTRPRRNPWQGRSGERLLKDLRDPSEADLPGLPHTSPRMDRRGPSKDRPGTSHPLRTEEEESTIKDLNQDSSSSSSSFQVSPGTAQGQGRTVEAPHPGEAAGRTAQDPEIDVRALLNATKGLFGERVLGKPERYPNARLLLGWIADAHVNRKHIRRPARVVYVQAASGALPDEQILADPCAFLPRAFLVKAHLPVPVETDAAMLADEAAEAWEEELPEEAAAEALAPLPPPDPSLDLPAGAGGHSPSAAQAWTLALELVQENYGALHLEQAALEWFEPKPPMLVVTAPAAQVGWLQQRLAKALERALVGICRQEVRVAFLPRDESG